ncbi:hypothetical protein L3X38_012130 [Prunus dulcis]|uniref:Uncharacterized protein n=1 Tax=Prunus dulcis TaxID=3755 RepID=A0AAD4WIQ5_PRUDU|nr:hypothetical protein L3X38_012130 [Prunus dulcis]
MFGLLDQPHFEVLCRYESLWTKLQRVECALDLSRLFGKCPANVFPVSAYVGVRPGFSPTTCAIVYTSG